MTLTVTLSEEGTKGPSPCPLPEGKRIILPEGEEISNTSAKWHHWPFLRKQQSRFVECIEILDSRLRGNDTI